MTASPAEVVREYGPFPHVEAVHGVTYDGRLVWFAAGDALHAFDPASGQPLRSIEVAAHAGTAFDGRHLFQLAEDRIQKSRRPGACSPPFRLQETAATRVSRGPKELCGSATIGSGGFIRSIRRPERFSGRLRPIDSSPA